MPRKKINLPLCPVDFPCLNCNQPMTLTSQIKLYCSDLCRDEAKFVRYFRACRNDGRINQPDVKDALLIRMAHILSGGYKESERRLRPSERRAVIGRDKGLCQKCGQPGTDIDHINGSSNELENLQLLCKTCHNEKTKSRLVPLPPGDEEGAEIKAKKVNLLLRANSLTPQRGCDDEETWRTINRQVMSERQQALYEERLKYASQIRGNKEMREGVEESKVDIDSLTQELNELGKLKEQHEALGLEKAAQIAQVYTPEIRARVEEIEAEFASRDESIRKEITDLEARVKARAVKYGETVRGANWQAVWSRGQARWDTKSIDKYAESHQEILVFRIEGQPSVSIRKIQRKPNNHLSDE